MRKLSEKAKQQLIDEMLIDVSKKENEFPVVHDLSEVPNKFKGIAMEINDRGNITVWNVFKNGNCREIASRV